MRTTVTPDDDVARLLDEAAHRDRRSLNDVVNEALRRALRPEPTAPDTVDVDHSKIRAGAGLRRRQALPRLDADRLRRDIDGLIDSEL